MPRIPTPYLYVASPQNGGIAIVGTTAGLRALLHATLDALLHHRPRQRLTYRLGGASAELYVELVTEPGLQGLVQQEP
jgi:hypothetical protein